MMHIHFVMHEQFEAPGAIETWVKNRAYASSYSRVYKYDPLPSDIADIDLLVVLGGPQSPNTSKAECPHFDTAAEQGLINKCINGGKAVLGVCLGAQLIGEALGARCEHSPEKEIGKFKIWLTEEGLKDSKLSHFGNTMEVGHWHNDMPGLTEDSKVLAFSEGCPRQIIRYGDIVYGFQCHMEFTASVVEMLVENSDGEIEKAARSRFVQEKEALAANDYGEMNNVLFAFLDKLVLEYERRNKS